MKKEEKDSKIVEGALDVSSGAAIGAGLGTAAAGLTMGLAGIAAGASLGAGIGGVVGLGFAIKDFFEEGEGDDEEGVIK